MPLPHPLRPLSSLVLTTLLAALPLVALPLAAPAAAAVPGTSAVDSPVPAVPDDLPPAIEDLAAYVPQTSCEPSAKVGTRRLGNLLVTTYPGTRYGGARACGASPNSEHYDGRAVDWMNSIRVKKQAAQASAFIQWLLGDDAAGNRFANARRLGVMYVIWNGKIWGAYSADRGWRPYSTCADHPEKGWDTACHRDHMHISLSWEGARGRTSFWTGEVAERDYGPCRPADLSWAAPYPTSMTNTERCPRYAAPVAPEGSSPTMLALVRYSGTVLSKGSKGAAVSAVRVAVGLRPGRTFGSGTKAAVKRFQTAHDLQATGAVDAETWRALLADQAPPPAA